MQLRTGVCLEGRYFLMEVLGVGGTSTVFLAMDERIQRKRAVKAIRKAKFSQEKIWEKEGLLLKRLRHKNIAELFDILEDQEFVYFVMEYVEGYTLRELMTAGYVFSQEQVIALGMQICEALICIHGQKSPVVYGDLKPENLMLEKGGRIVLIDFGASRFYEKKEKERCWGTERYAAPEQKKGQGRTDVRADLYSLGILLYEMLCGTAFSMDRMDKNGSDLERIIEKCTRRLPEKRYQDALSVKKELQRACSGKWKLDKRYKKKIFFSGVVWSFSLGLLALSGIFSQQAEILQREGYERYMAAGERGIESQERIQAFSRAVELNPWKPEGYFALLKEYRRELFSQEEYGDFLELLSRENEEGISYETCLAQSEEWYGKLSYELGIACYFEWEGYGNKKYAFPWLEQAGKCEGLTREERELTLCLASVAGYYGNITRGREELTYPEKKMACQYWKDLQKMMEIPEAFELKKLVWKEAAGQILQYLDIFQESGIDREELKSCLEDIKRKDTELETVIREGEGLLELMETAEQKS